MVPKNEYQPWYGGEITSPREYSEQWMDLHLRPECKQFRGMIKKMYCFKIFKFPSYL